MDAFAFWAARGVFGAFGSCFLVPIFLRSWKGSVESDTRTLPKKFGGLGQLDPPIQIPYGHKVLSRGFRYLSLGKF